MEAGELLGLGVAVHVELSDLDNQFVHQSHQTDEETRLAETRLFGIGQDGLELAEEALCADVVVEVADADRELLRLELLDRLDEDLCGQVRQVRSALVASTAADCSPTRFLV